MTAILKILVSCNGQPCTQLSRFCFTVMLCVSRHIHHLHNLITSFRTVINQRLKVKPSSLWFTLNN